MVTQNSVNAATASLKLLVAAYEAEQPGQATVIADWAARCGRGTQPQTAQMAARLWLCPTLPQRWISVPVQDS